jgi:hypothetical protein
MRGRHRIPSATSRSLKRNVSATQTAQTTTRTFCAASDIWAAVKIREMYILLSALN